jgi:hypothetical protein
MLQQGSERAYNKRQLGGHYQADLKRLLKQLRADKKMPRRHFRSVLQSEGKCWTEFCKYVKRRKGNREKIPAIKDCNGRPITDSIEKANSLNLLRFCIQLRAKYPANTLSALR